jgi:hypothetical protein
VNLKSAVSPAFFKVGFFGNTGSGKTYTAAKILSQFIAKYVKDSQLAMFDTEPSAGYIKQMVKNISGKELLAINSRSFSDLMDFSDECIAKKYVALVDSVTHPWRTLCADYLEAKRSRVRSANGRDDLVKLSLKDWGPLKDIWATFSEKFVYSPIHFCICGREGDVWDTVVDEEGKEEMKKTGVKMKTENEFGYEPSLLVQMKLIGTEHVAFVQKDRFDLLTGQTSKNKPDIEFFAPHIDALSIGGNNNPKSEGKKVFVNQSGPSWETIKAQRAALLENIKDDLLLTFPGQTAEHKKSKVESLRKAFGTSAWTELEEDERKHSLESLRIGREKLSIILKETSDGAHSK